MTIRTLALASATTSIQDHRLSLGAFMGPGSSVLERRGGICYYPGAADLVSAASLQANVTPFVAVVDGTSNALQGQAVVVVDANVTLTFSAGEAAVARTDRVVLQIRDNTYDASGFTDARVLVVKGNTSTGAANAVPASSLWLWDVVVPIGASSITFASARVDRRQWTFTPMRAPVNSSTERDALPAVPGLEVTRLDTGEIQQYWSGAWRTLLPVAAPTSQVSFARKTADTGRASTTTNTADPHLVLPVLANSTYIIDFFLDYQALAAAHIDFELSVPAGAIYKVNNASITGVSTGWNGQTNFSLVGSVDGFASGTLQGTGANRLVATPRAIVRTAGTAGNCALSWAQATSNATASTIYTDSFMRMEKVA